jgi:hypothetical protein
MLCLFLISITASAEVYFTNTKEKTTLRKTYSRGQMLNKKVAKVNAFANREYYVFLGRDVNTLINLPYALKEKIINPAPTFLDIGDSVGETYFFIKPKNVEGILDGFKSTFHIICDNGFRILVNIEIIKPDSANQSITFIDGLSQDAKSFVDPSLLQKDISNLKNTVSKREQLIHNVMYGKIQKVSIGSEMNYKGHRVRLDNVVKSNRSVFFNFTISGEDIIEINPKEIVLETQNFSPTMIGSDNKKRNVHTPSAIFTTDGNDINQSIIVVFNDVPDESVFQANLKLHPYIAFNQKLNFGLSEISDASFNVDF